MNFPGDYGIVCPICDHKRFTDVSPRSSVIPRLSCNGCKTISYLPTWEFMIKKAAGTVSDKSKHTQSMIGMICPVCDNPRLSNVTSKYTHELTLRCNQCRTVAYLSSWETLCKKIAEAATPAKVIK